MKHGENSKSLLKKKPAYYSAESPRGLPCAKLQFCWVVLFLVTLFKKKKKSPPPPTKKTTHNLFNIPSVSLVCYKSYLFCY